MSRRGPSLSTARLPRLSALVLLALAVLAVTWSGGSPADAEQGSLDVTLEARVVAQKHPSGAVELAIEQDGERHLPTFRFVTVNAPTGQWLRSSPVTFSVDVAQPEPEVVERIVEVDPPVERLSVRPSDYEDAGLVCLEQEDEDGNTWTRLDETGEVTGFGTGFGVYSAGTWNGSALELQLAGAPEEDWREFQLASAWHAQCAQYHGAAGLPHDHATDPDAWMATDTAQTDQE